MAGDAVMAGIAPQLPAGEFDLLYADPGLVFQGWSHKGEDRSPQHHYRCEPVDVICGLPVASIASVDAILAIWAYGPRLPDTLSIIVAWGFTYVAKGFCWEKVTRTGQPRMGLGHTTRKVTEDCLLARRGKGLKRCDRGVSELIRAPRREPGRKPEEVRHRLERLYGGDVRRIELFARGKAPDGWTFWGDQAEPNSGLHSHLSTAEAWLEGVS
jgi:N6-adenosine-specific RNA methylase IME4